MSDPVTYQWGNLRRYNAYSEWFSRKFGKRVQKLSLNAGFTCPNRDGTTGTGGCTYCNNDAFSPSYCTPDKSVSQQLEEGIEFHRRRYRRADTYLAYFQSYTNTYAGLDQLKKLYSEALSYPSIVGMVIGTRPDCVSADVLDWLALMAEKYFIIVEYGIESISNDTLKKINRGHDFETSVWAVKETSGRGIRTGAHLIFGLPGESRKQIIESASVISDLPLNSVKIHQLQMIKGTAMTARYEKHPEEFDIYSLNEYIDLAVAFCERLAPSIMIERISGEAPPRMLSDPRDWKLRNYDIFRLFEERMEMLDTWQGKYYEKH